MFPGRSTLVRRDTVLTCVVNFWLQLQLLSTSNEPRGVQLATRLAGCRPHSGRSGDNSLYLRQMRCTRLFVYVFGATTRVVGQMAVLFAFVRDVVAKCTDVSEERTVSIFRVATVVTVNPEVIQWNKYVSCIRIVGDIWPITAAEGRK